MLVIQAQISDIQRSMENTASPWDVVESGLNDKPGDNWVSSA